MNNKSMPTVVSYMTPFPYVIDASVDLKAAQEMMKEHDIRHLPVKSEGDVIGVISEHDIEHAIDYGHAKADSEYIVSDLCGKRGVVVDSHTPLDIVIEKMVASRAGSAAICRNGDIVGILTHTDICNHFITLLHKEFRTADTSGGDEAA